MSHLMAYAFERFVFFQASAADRQSISALSQVGERLDPARTAFYHHLHELADLRPRDLLICCGTSLAVASRAAHELGHVATLRLGDFQNGVHSFLNLQSTSIFGEVVLAFLPEILKRQAMRIFSLFGFNAVSVDSSQGLMKELKHGAGIVVFDQDMPVLKGRVAESREKIFSLLRAERKAQRQLAVIIIKDFDQGSLFGDMMTMAKDVSNAMLSPAEFLEFIRNYLCDFHTSHATWRVRLGNATGLAHSTYAGRPSVSLGLSDIKCAFQHSQDKAYHEYSHAREQMIVEARDLSARMAVTEWLFDRQLAQEADAQQKSLIVKNEMPRLFEISRAPEPASEPAPGSPAGDERDSMFR